MIKYNFSFLFLIPLFFIHNSTVSSDRVSEEDGVWTGTVSFLETQTGKEIEVSEWKMEAKIINNKTTAVHSFKFRDKNDNISDCRNEDQTELEVGIDYGAGTYGITVPMPGCYGKQISGGTTRDFAKSDETAISIDNQKLGKDPNILEGTITTKDVAETDGIVTTTTYKWRLVRVNKTSKPVSQNSKPVIPPVTQPPGKEKWSGTVNWYKTSTSKARVEEQTVTSHWNDFFIFDIKVQFVNSKGAVYRADKTTKWRLDSIDFVKKGGREMVEEKNTIILCDGKEEMELSVLYSDDRKYYWVSFYTPECPENITYDVRNNIHGNTHNTSIRPHQGGQITVPANFTGQPIGNNPNVLTGTWEEIIPAPNDPGGGTIITRATWTLRKN